MELLRPNVWIAAHPEHFLSYRRDAVALRATNAKFGRRFRYIEARLAERGRTPAQSDLPEMDGLWDEAKAAEKAG